MGERVLEIVILLISRIKDQHGRLESFEDISSYLKSYGFTDTEISSAYSWVLDQIHTDSKFLIDDSVSGNSFRILTDQERRDFSIEAVGYMLQLRFLGILGDTQMELILERGVAMGPSPVSLDQMKILVSSVLFHDSNFVEHGKQPMFFLSSDDGLLN